MEAAGARCFHKETHLQFCHRQKVSRTSQIIIWTANFHTKIQAFLQILVLQFLLAINYVLLCYRAVIGLNHLPRGKKQSPRFDMLFLFIQITYADWKFLNDLLQNIIHVPFSSPFGQKGRIECQTWTTEFLSGFDGVNDFDTSWVIEFSCSFHNRNGLGLRSRICLFVPDLSRMLVLWLHYYLVLSCSLSW